MNMMKEMYQNGDEDMKRTIAESWMKAQDGKATGEPMSNKWSDFDNRVFNNLKCHISSIDSPNAMMSLTRLS